ncbi:unnamed protein product [Clonostachys rosea]|uniref:Zn(2)-C6 fungal-type domain-containing protein n=1 Tax=Bionectria ochroleuca TaxID=29856 RepID=A0ABY6UP32_BIOOC|nr:unnamed protein product [Clonostachys rosea]
MDTSPACPYQCSLCGSKFEMVGDLERHVSDHEEGTRPAKRSRVTQQRSAPRAIQACRACAASKTKCDNERQCKRCRRRGTSCVRPVETIELLGDNGVEELGHADLGVTVAGQGNDAIALDVEFRTVTDFSRPDEPGLDDTRGSDRPLSEPSFYPPLSPPSANALAPSGAGTIPKPHSNENLWDSCLIEDSFGYDLETYVVRSPEEFLFAFPRITTSNEEKEITTNCSNLNGPALISPLIAGDKSQCVADAFRKVTGRWIPVARNFQEEEEKNLSATRGTNIIAEEAPSLGGGPELLPRGFPLAVRDRLLAMLVSASDMKDKPRIPAAFPSCEALASLFKSYVAYHVRQDDTWIHFGTFDIAEARVELVAALVAAGALRSPNRSVQKFGLAVHEIMSIWIQETSRISNILTRDLQFLQAYMLQIQIGFWSGEKRKMEQAGGSLGNIVNMLRGGGRYRQTLYTSITPEVEGFSTSVEERWKHWAVQESFIRLVHHVYLHSGEQALLSSVSSPLSSAEMTLPLPAARSAWLAKNGPEWRDTCQSQPDLRVSWADCLGDVSHLRQLPACCDTNVARLAVVCALFPTLRAYQHSHKSTAKDVSKTREWILLEDSQHRWLSKTLENIHGSLRVPFSNSPPSSTVFLAVELASLHLQTWVDQLELLAGKEGLADAQEAYRLLQTRWIDSQDSRQALWHAGQILRLARAIQPEAMSDFVAVCVYHASLCIWAYGTIQERTRRDGSSHRQHRPATLEPTSAPPFDDSHIIIDQEETIDVQRWILHGNGNPVVAGCKSVGRRSPVSLSSTEALMQLCVMTVRSRFPLRGVLPPAIENLCALMGTLGSAHGGAARLGDH